MRAICVTIEDHFKNLRREIEWPLYCDEGVLDENKLGYGNVRKCLKRNACSLMQVAVPPGTRVTKARLDDECPVCGARLAGKVGYYDTHYCGLSELARTSTVTDAFLYFRQLTGIYTWLGKLQPLLQAPVVAKLARTSTVNNENVLDK